MKHSLKTLAEKRVSGVPITWLTCYEYSFATALNQTELDMILVGDSGGMCALGYSDTIPVTMDEMIFLASAVRRGAPDKFIVGDMPKGSYELSDYDAIKNAMRFVKESGCDAVKLEGGTKMAARVNAIAEAGIPIIGHIGLTPQTSSAFGGYRVVGRSSSEFDELSVSVGDLERAGVFAILIEATPPEVAAKITKNANSIIFGIGAGNMTHGQLLILHDLIGLYPSFRPKFAKCYIPGVISEFATDLAGKKDIVEFGRKERKDGIHELTKLSVDAFIREVVDGKFPTSLYSYKS